MALTGDNYSLTTVSNGTDASWSPSYTTITAPETGWYEVKWDTQPAVERKNVRGLFEVFIVDPEAGSVHSKALVVANDAEAAKLKAIRQNYANDVDIDDFDIIVDRIGDVRAKAKG